MTDYDVIVVGSGFGGSVSALRLTEKGYRVGVLEAGRRFTPETLPRTSWDVRNFLWMPRLSLRGIQRITLLKDIVVLSAAGVGGGSLVYANTLYRPPPTFFDDPRGAGITLGAAGGLGSPRQHQRQVGRIGTEVGSTPVTATTARGTSSTRLGCIHTPHEPRKCNGCAAGLHHGVCGQDAVDPKVRR